jgi:hypothetical protein
LPSTHGDSMRSADLGSVWLKGYSSDAVDFTSWEHRVVDLSVFTQAACKLKTLDSPHFLESICRNIRPISENFIAECISFMSVIEV